MSWWSYIGLGVKVKGHWVKVKCHMGQGKIIHIPESDEQVRGYKDPRSKVTRVKVK